jgi:hypothetical protein
VVHQRAAAGPGYSKCKMMIIIFRQPKLKI